MPQQRSSGLADMLKPLSEAPPVNGRSRRAGQRGKAAPAVEQRRGPGRPRGKRSNPDFEQFGVWLKRASHLDATDRLRRRQEYPDFSELVQALVERWLKE
jgi:hypothetical protein